MTVGAYNVTVEAHNDTLDSKYDYQTWRKQCLVLYMDIVMYKCGAPTLSTFCFGLTCELHVTGVTPYTVALNLLSQNGTVVRFSYPLHNTLLVFLSYGSQDARQYIR